MGIPGKTIRCIEASIAVQHNQSAAETPFMDEIKVEPQSSYFANAWQMVSRQHHQALHFLSGCDFIIGPGGCLLPKCPKEG